MTDKQRQVEQLDVIEGADAGSLGIDEPPTSAPPGATVDPGQTRVPGEPMDGPGHEAKPWHTSLAAESDQAGVANEPPGEQEAQYPTGDDEAF
jgi:hypothetical protein